MAHSEKYYHEYCNSVGIICRVSILEEGFVGSATECEAQQTPFLKAYDNAEDFLFVGIQPSTGVAQLALGTGNGVDFSELWDADENDFKIEHYINGALEWTGFVIPQSFERALVGGIYYANIRAACGLAKIENILFLDDNTLEPYGTQDLTYNDGFLFPGILIATEILRKLDLNLNTWSCVDLVERNMDPTDNSRAGDPLAGAFFNVKVYINDTERKDIPYWKDAGQVFNCKEVLQNLCYEFGANLRQSEGVWRFKTVGSDANYGSGPTQRYWHKYNTAATWLSREAINDEVTIPCATIDQALIGQDHVIRMDDAFGAFRVNYKYQLLRDGDNAISLIPNGVFSNWNNTSKLAAPQGWSRWRWANEWHLSVRPILVVDLPLDFIYGLEWGRQAAGQSTSQMDVTTHPWNSLRLASQPPVTKGDRLFFKFWLKWFQIFDAPGSFLDNTYTFLFRLGLYTGSKIYWLVNDGTNAEYGRKGTRWLDNEEEQAGPGDDLFFSVTSDMANIPGNLESVVWRFFEFELVEVPDNGRLVFDIMGPAQYRGNDSGNFPKMKTYLDIKEGDTFRKVYTPRDGNFSASGGFLPQPRLTGFELNKLPDPSEFAEGQDYIYENPLAYSLEVDPIEVLHGDVLDPQHLSRIVVPVNLTSGKNFWDTIDGQYGKSSLGLTVCRSIMQRYFKPFRILEGTIKSPGVTIDTRFVFEAIPDKKFVLMRGTFNEKDNYIEDATFREITEVALPSGGIEGRSNLEPQWIRNGNVRCKKDGSNLNNGEVEAQEVDRNINSETYLQTRWTVIRTDLVACPLGDPTSYYFGTDDVTLEVSNLVTSPFFVDGDDVTVEISNPGGEYIYFVHLSSLGLVGSVETEGQPEILSDFQYLSDIVEDGFTYKVLRQNGITTAFNNFSVTFKFV